MEKLFGSPKAVGLRVKVKRSDGKVARGTIDKVNANGLVSVVFDPEYVGEWEDNFEYFSAKDIKPDYDAEGMKARVYEDHCWPSGTYEACEVISNRCGS